MSKQGGNEVFGSITKKVADQCRALSCPLLESVVRGDETVPACRVLADQEYGLYPQVMSLLLASYDEVPDACPTFSTGDSNKREMTSWVADQFEFKLAFMSKLMFLCGEK